MKCIECNNLGYFTGVISLGLQEGHPYLQPHIERCDTCQVFTSDEEAKLNSFDENFKPQAASDKPQAASNKQPVTIRKRLDKSR
jgi:hypothetical protein